jgi:hypothetical protein
MQQLTIELSEVLAMVIIQIFAGNISFLRRSATLEFRRGVSTHGVVGLFMSGVASATVE